MMENVICHFSTIDDGNMSFFTCDSKEDVQKNREKLAKKISINAKEIVSAKQNHGNKIEIITSNSPKIIEDCDGLITNEKNLPLLVTVADCLPVFLYDESKQVIAALHVSRNTTLLNIVKNAVEKMVKEFKCDPKDIVAVVGPSIHKCCYEVDQEIANIFEKNFGKEFVENRKIDLQGLNKKILNDLGVEKVIVSPICTKCSNRPYYSHRKGDEKRFCGIISLF